MKEVRYHICNHSTPELSGFVNIVSKEALLEIVENNNTFYLLNIHLNWEGRRLSSDYGFDVANALRTEKKSKAPIIFYSPIQQEFFEKKSENEIKYKLLFGRGSGFLELPVSEEQVIKLAESIKTLSEAALHDVTAMLCDLRGIVIDKLTHGLKFGVDVDAVISTVLPYLSSYQRESIHLAENVAKLKESIANKNQLEFDTLKEAYIKICKRKLLKQPAPEEETEKSNYSVLVIDDVQEELDKFQKHLGDHFALITTQSAKDAVILLKEDLENDIVAVVADWRLYTDNNNTYWQPLQGYEALDYAAKNGLRALFALTSQDEDIVHDIRNIQGIKFQLYKKQNLQNAGQWKLLGNVLAEFCEEMLLVRAGIPDSDNWKKSERKIDNTEATRLKKKGRVIKKVEDELFAEYPSFHSQYLQMLHSPEKQNILDGISAKADEVWNYLESIRECNENYEGVEVLREVFDLETPKDASLFPVMVLRRIWLALWFSIVDESQKLNQEMISDYSKKVFSIIQNKGNVDFQGNKHQAEQTKLCISIPQVRNKKLLPEEITWLRKWNIF